MFVMDSSNLAYNLLLMGKQDRSGGGNRFRKEHNNYNPYNKLDLNKFHQTKGQNQNHYGHQLHKRKRDLQRMIDHFKSKGKEVDQAKLDELSKIQQELGSRKKEFEKDKRKEFFLSSKYKQIMNIQKRKVAKKIRDIKEKEPVNRDELGQWFKKLNYIKYFPKNLKYISLFPTTPISEKALEFQNKIIKDVNEDLAKKKEKLNKFEAEYKTAPKLRPSKKDDFFLMEEEQKPEKDQQQELLLQENEQEVEEQQEAQGEQEQEEQEQEQEEISQEQK